MRDGKGAHVDEPKTSVSLPSHIHPFLDIFVGAWACPRPPALRHQHVPHAHGDMLAISHATGTAHL